MAVPSTAMAGEVVLPVWVDAGAVGIGALAAASAVIRRNQEERAFDVVGVITLAFVGGFGGGLIRDVLLNVRPAAFQTNWYVLAGTLAVLVAWAANSLVHRINGVLVVLDALTLASFAALGALKAERLGVPLLPVIIVGVLAGAGGTVLRDVLLARIPALLRPTEPYGIAAFVSAVVMAAWSVSLGSEWVGFGIAVLAGTAVRVVSVWRGWQTAAVVPLPPAVPARISTRIVRRRREPDPPS
jgi:uncharacterized membrane protein YeiH